MKNFAGKPEWLTFDCYGTLIQWDEGLLAAVQDILTRSGAPDVSSDRLIRLYDRKEHELECERPHLPFRAVAGRALEYVPSLSQLKRMGFKLCIVSNTDDDIIAGNVAQLGGHIDRVITAQQAQAYKPTSAIFRHAHAALGVTKDDVIHICASPVLDLQAARDLGFRCIWIDRHTGRVPLRDYTPDAIFNKLDGVPVLFRQLGWS
jgi:2-haloacid dehalogenase